MRKSHAHTNTQEMTIEICNWTPFIWFVLVWFDLICSLFAVSLQIVWQFCWIALYALSSSLVLSRLEFQIVSIASLLNLNLIQSIPFANDKRFAPPQTNLSSQIANWFNVVEWNYETMDPILSDNKFNFLSFGHCFNGFTMVTNSSHRTHLHTPVYHHQLASKTFAKF